MKRFFVYFLTFLTVLFLIVIVYINSNFVFVSGNKYKINATTIKIDFLLKNEKTLKNISKLHNLCSLELNKADSEILKSIPQMDSITSLNLSFSKVDDATVLNSMRNLEKIHMLESEIDVTNCSLKKVNSIDFVSCDITSLYCLNNLDSLRELSIFKCSGTELVKEDYEFVLKDSSVFSEMENITKLSVKGYVIQDASGFANMKSLKYLYVDDEALTNEQVEKLKNAGIEVNPD